MNKFWEWMKKNGYGEHDHCDPESEMMITEIYNEKKDKFTHRKQTLIGYMIEYLNDKHEHYEFSVCLADKTERIYMNLKNIIIEKSK